MAFGAESGFKKGVESCMKVFEDFPVLWKEAIFFNTFGALRQWNMGVEKGFDMWATVESSAD